MQRADDAGRQIRAIYMGAEGVRWWVDWTFPEWGLAVVTFLAGLVLFPFVIPAGAVAAVGVYWFARTISRMRHPDAPRRQFWTIVGLFVLLLAAVSPHPSTWLLPLHWWIALLADVGAPFLAVRLFGRFIDWNRPVGYWAKVPGRVAAGPRPHPQASMNVSRLIGMDLDRAEPLTGVVIKPQRGRRKVAKAAPVSPIRKRFIARTDLGLRVGNTEYRFERSF